MPSATVRTTAEVAPEIDVELHAGCDSCGQAHPAEHRCKGYPTLAAGQTPRSEDIANRGPGEVSAEFERRYQEQARKLAALEKKLAEMTR